MNRKYPQVVNRNFRDDSTEWTWSTKYAEWLAIAEQHRHHRFTALERALCQQSNLERTLATGTASEL